MDETLYGMNVSSLEVMLSYLMLSSDCTHFIIAAHNLKFLFFHPVWFTEYLCGAHVLR